MSSVVCDLLVSRLLFSQITARLQQVSCVTLITLKVWTFRFCREGLVCSTRSSFSNTRAARWELKLVSAEEDTSNMRTGRRKHLRAEGDRRWQGDSGSDWTEPVSGQRTGQEHKDRTVLLLLKARVQRQNLRRVFSRLSRTSSWECWVSGVGFTQEGVFISGFTPVWDQGATSGGGLKPP